MRIGSVGRDPPGSQLAKQRAAKTKAMRLDRHPVLDTQDKLVFGSDCACALAWENGRRFSRVTA